MKIIILLLILSSTLFAKNEMKEFFSYWKAGVISHQTNPKEAINSYKKAIKIKESSLLYGNIADCYRKLNNEKEANHYFELAIKKSEVSRRPVDNLYYQYSYFLYQIDNKKAKKYILKAIELDNLAIYRDLLTKIEDDIILVNKEKKRRENKYKLANNQKHTDSIKLVKKDIQVNNSDEDEDEDEEESDNWITKLDTNSRFRPSTLFRSFYKSKFYQDRVLDNGLEDASEWHNDLFIELKHQFSNNTTVILSSELNWFLLTERNEEGDYYFFNGENPKTIFEYELRESYFDYKTDFFSLKIGNQIFKWGENIGFSRSDMLNPTDISSGIIPDIDDRKLAVFAINTGLSFKNNKITLVVIPIRKDPKISLWGRDFSILQPSKKTDTSVINRFIDPTVEDGMQNIPAITKDQTKSGLESSVALRFTSTFWDINLSTLLYYGYQQLPEFYMDKNLKKLLIYGLAGVKDDQILSPLAIDVVRRYSLGENVVTSEYKRYRAAAFSLSYPIKSVLFKIDASYEGDKLYYTEVKDVVGDNSDADNKAIDESLNPLYKKVVNYTFGLEYQYLVDRLIFDLEIIGTHILDDKDEDYFYARKNQVGVFSFIKWKVVPNEWTLFLLGNYNIFFKDYLFTFRVTKHFKDLDLILGYDHFGGKENTPIGRYDKNDQFMISTKYFF